MKKRFASDIKLTLLPRGSKFKERLYFKVQRRIRYVPRQIVNKCVVLGVKTLMEDSLSLITRSKVRARKGEDDGKELVTIR